MVGRCNCCCRSPPTPEPVKNIKHEDSNVIQISTITYKKENKNQETNTETECVLCLSPFDDGECIRKLPGCNHVFHASCIDVWLSSHSNCPLCRSPVNRVACNNGELTLEAENSQVVAINNSLQIELSRVSRREAGPEIMV